MIVAIRVYDWNDKPVADTEEIVRDRGDMKTLYKKAEEFCIEKKGARWDMEVVDTTIRNARIPKRKPKMEPDRRHQ